MTTLTLSFLLLALSPEISVVVLPLDHEKADKKLALEMTDTLREVLLEIHGVACQDCMVQGKALRDKITTILKRCGKKSDCRRNVGVLLSANLVVAGRVESLGQGILLELELLDVGSGKLKGKVSRTLAGSRLRRAAALEAMLTEILFPERIVGKLDIFIQPANATIFIDGREKVKHAGSRVHLKDIRSGQHTVRIEKKGFTDFYAIVQIPYQGTTKLEVRLRPGTTGGNEAVKPEQPEVSSGAWYTTWWFWTIVGAITVTAGVVAAVGIAD
jgi:hypothetical protein